MIRPGEPGPPGPAAAPAVERLSSVLAARAGDYLSNPVRQAGLTCATCATPAPGYERCLRCAGDQRRGPAADATAFLTYAIAGQPSGYLMRGYKADPPVAAHRQVVTLLLAVSLARHARCAAVLAGRPVTHWAVVPSLPAKPGPHPLREVVARLAPRHEIPLAAAGRARYPRDLSPGHFSCPARLRAGAHVLLIDDTWAMGGHAQSAALALRAAGAGRVSLLVAARWLKADFGDNSAILRRSAGRRFDPATCPWTGAGCPQAAPQELSA